MWQSRRVTDVRATVTWLSIPDVAEALDVPLGKVHRLIEEHHLIEARIDGVRRVPADAIQNGEPMPALRGTIHVLLDSGFTLETALDWLYTPHESLGMTPMAALVAGRKTEIRRLAQALAL